MKSFSKFSRFVRITAMLLCVVMIAGLVGMKSVKTAEAAPNPQKVTISFYERPQYDNTQNAVKVGEAIQVSKGTTLSQIEIPLKKEEGKTYKVSKVYTRQKYYYSYNYTYTELNNNTKINIDTALYVVYEEVKTPSITIKTQPVDYPFYNSNGESGFDPKFSLVASVANVKYEKDMYFEFNWQELRKGATEYIDSPLTTDNTTDASAYYKNGKWDDITDTVNIRTDGKPDSGRVVAREGAKFKCNVILKDKDGNTICEATTNEVEVVYTVRVTLHDGEKSETISDVRYGTLVKDVIPDSYDQEGMVTTWQTRTQAWDWNQGNYYVYTDYDTNQAVKTTPLDLYVKREAVKYEVSFVMNDHGKQVPAQTVEHGKYATEPTKPTDNDYTFLGWLDVNGNPFEFENTAITSETVLYANWAKSKTTVTFLSLNEKGQAAHGYTNGIVKSFEITIGEKIAKKDIPTPSCTTAQVGTKHKFLGWYQEAECENEFNFENTKITTETNIYSKWGNEYTVTFDGKNLINKTVPSQNVDEGEKAKEPEGVKAKNKGEYFVGWYLGNDSYDFNTPVEGPITLTAKTATYPTVTFDMNHHGGKNQTVTVGSDFKVPTGKIPNPTDPEYDFVEWQYEGQKYTFDTEIKSNITLTAKWSKKVVKWTVTFVAREYGDPYNRTGRHGFKEYSISVEDGTAISRPEGIPECTYHDNHIFDDWYTTIELKDKFDFSQQIHKNTTIYSGWFILTGKIADGYQDTYELNEPFNLDNLKLTIEYSHIEGGKAIKTESVNVTKDMITTNVDDITKTAGTKTVNVEYEIKEGKKVTGTFNIFVNQGEGFITLEKESYERTYGDANFSIGFSNPSGNVSFVSGRTDVVTVDNKGNVKIVSLYFYI